VSGTQAVPGPARDRQPSLRWRLAVYYEDGRERIGDVLADSAADAISSMLELCSYPDLEIARVVVVVNPLRQEAEGKRHDVVVPVPDAAMLVEERLRKNGKLVDGPAEVSYRVGVEHAEIVFSQRR
jgi:hypothetical protein